jgi:hypothetical protein
MHAPPNGAFLPEGNQREGGQVESEMIDAPPLPTELELKTIEQRLDTEPINAYSCTSCGAVNHLPTDGRHDHVAFEIPRLVAQIRRLRQLVIDAKPHVPENQATRAMELPARLRAGVDRG